MRRRTTGGSGGGGGGSFGGRRPGSYLLGRPSPAGGGAGTGGSRRRPGYGAGGHDGGERPAATAAAAAAATGSHAPATGLVHATRNGIYYASELLHQPEAALFHAEFGGIERVCLMRFPPEIAAVLRTRLSAAQGKADGDDTTEAAAGSEVSSFGAGGAEQSLGLTITPTPKEDFRLFEVAFQQSLGEPHTTIHLWGLLVEMPTLIEGWKSFDGDLLFKANDISQMMYVFHPAAPARELGERPVAETDEHLQYLLRRVRDGNLWELSSGLTPATHRIRARKFRNYRVFDPADVAAAERELLATMVGAGAKSVSEEAKLEVITEEQLLKQIDRVKRPGQALFPEDPTVVGIITPENPLLKAVMRGVAPASLEGTNQDLLRGTIRGASAASAARIDAEPLEERLTYCNDPARPPVQPDQAIRDDISDILFNELSETGGRQVLDPEADAVERLEELNALEQNSESPQSDLSTGGGPSLSRKSKKRHHAKSVKSAAQPVGENLARNA